MERFTIAHSHSTFLTGDHSLRNILWKTMSYPTRFVADYYMACSKEAGLDRFGKKVIESDSFKVVKNGIRIKRFAVSKEKRKIIRKEYGIGNNQFVIGHAGRFDSAKNQAYVIRIFNEIAKNNADCVLMLVGDGITKKSLEKRVESLNIAERVIFTGTKSNIEDYYSAMDMFVFPSLQEGLGMVAIEAQASGLMVIASDEVPQLADLNVGLFKQLPLEREVKKWMFEILEEKRKERERELINQKLEKSDYDISIVANELEKFYLDRSITRR